MEFDDDDSNRKGDTGSPAMIDTYTNAILTVIAFALLILVGQNYNLTKPAKAAFSECGSRNDPCRMIICASTLECK